MFISHNLAKKMLFKFSPETAHAVTLNALEMLENLHLSSLFFGKPPIGKPIKIMDLEFKNPIGLAAGLDKNADCIDGLGALGFGFVEVGTITPRPQAGNPQPRLFRVPEANAIINRMGFNNKGVDYLLANVVQRHFKGILGINIGKNADTPLEKALEDYLICLKKVYVFADYITINLSSPNTPNLRKLQHGEELDRLLEHLKNAQSQLKTEHHKYVPLVLKIAPDLTDAEIEEIGQTLLKHQMDGVIATNTTSSRIGVEHLPISTETGGLSGAPVFEMSTQVVSKLSNVLKGKIPIIAAGGISNVEQAQAKLKAGASLIQIYTSFIYQGVPLVHDLIKNLK
jgi:dihydroorotate dehydrogenase